MYRAYKHMGDILGIQMHGKHTGDVQMYGGYTDVWGCTDVWGTY